VSASKVGTGFLDRKILMALTSIKLSKLGKSTRPYMSRAMIDSKALVFLSLAKAEAFL